MSDAKEKTPAADSTAPAGECGFAMNNSYGNSSDANSSCGNQAHDLEHAFAIAHQAQPPRARSGRRITVCAAADLPPGTRRIVDLGSNQSIGVFNLEGTFYAIKNLCPHYGAPLCQGTVHGTHRPAGVHHYEEDLAGRVLRCPWHGWEFDIPSGKGLYDRNSRVATYPVEVDAEGFVCVML